MRIVSYSVIAGVLLMAVGCASSHSPESDGGPKQMTGNAALLVATFPLGKGLAWNNVKESLAEKGFPAEDFDDVEEFEGRSGESVRSLLVFREGQSSKVRWIVQPDRVSSRSTLAVCIQGQGEKVVVDELRVDDRCAE